MDKRTLHDVLGHADELIALREHVHSLLSTLDAHAVVDGVGVQGVDTRFFPVSRVRWPQHINAHAELSSRPGAYDTLRWFMDDTAAVPQLRASAADATAGFLRRLFGGVDVNRAIADANALAQRVSDPVRYADVRMLLGIASTADAQPTDPLSGPGPRAIGRALNMPGAQVESYDGYAIFQVQSQVRALLDDPNSEPNLRRAADTHVRALNEGRAQELMTQLPVDSLKTVTKDRLRFGNLHSIGVTTVADVLRASAAALTAANGVGEQTAIRMKAAAQTLLNEAMSTSTPLIGDAPTPPAVALVRILARYEQCADVLGEVERDRRDRLVELCAQLPPSFATEPWLVAYIDPTAYAQAHDDMAWMIANPSLFQPRYPVDPGDDVWQDYLQRPAHYQSLLGSLLRIEAEGIDERHDAATLQRIRSLELDTTHVKNLFLRGYQSYGARFTVVQQKTILGDEMGLGKTIQAIAFAAHLYANGLRRIVVVCPASVMVNWKRELNAFCTMEVFVAHGPSKEFYRNSWASADSGGVLLCTFDGARVLDLSDSDVVIVDEAHAVKNPRSKRAQAVASVIAQCEYALLLTGTPMENRVSEFATLVGYVQPELITRGMESMSAEHFRRRVAPAYLRRNQEDVLDELPARINNDDWITLTPADQRMYTAAVEQGSFMDIRRAAFLAPGEPAKITRIKEILDDARDNNHRAIIFSYFRTVLDAIAGALDPELVAGVITGATPPNKRQDYVDALGKAPAGSTLLTQITAGGVGLNIQSASVVIIAEPQLKPTIEDQAIARAHRMGQTTAVNVHRLIGDDTVDERLLELLAGKRQLFEHYARPSESAGVADAVDVSEQQLAAAVIKAERQRLGIDNE